MKLIGNLLAVITSLCAGYPFSIAAAVYIVQPGDTNHPGLVCPIKVGDPDSFDGLMRTNAGPNSVVYIGSGTYETKGFWNNSANRFTGPGFRVQDNSKILGIGAGTNKPTLKLIGAQTKTPPAAPENMILATLRTSGLSNIVISNLVLDCNAPALTLSNTRQCT